MYHTELGKGPNYQLKWKEGRQEQGSQGYAVGGVTWMFQFKFLILWWWRHIPGSSGKV